MAKKSGLMRRSVVKLSAVINAVSSFWTFLIMFLVTADVLARTFFNSPILGVPELVKLSIVGIVFMSFAHTLETDRFIRSDVIIQILGPTGKEILNFLAYILGIAVFVAIFVASWGPTVESYQVWEFEGEGALRVPAYPIRTLILLGSLMTVLIYVFKLSDSIRALLKKE